MPKSTNLNFTQTLKNPCLSLTSANTTVAATLYTAGANDAVVKSLTVSSNDTSAVNLVISINNGTSDFVIGTVNIPINSGYTGAIASVDVLGSSLLPGLPRDVNNRAIIPLAAGFVLKVGALATMTAARVCNVVACVEEF